MIPPEVQTIWDAIPKFTCFRCGCCCGPVEVEPIEKRIIAEYCQINRIPVGDFFGDLSKRMRRASEGKWECPFLEIRGDFTSCRIYPVRPLLCRVQGITEGLPCPNHKAGTYPLSRGTVGNLFQLMRNIKV